MVPNLAHLGNFWQQCCAHTQKDFVELLAKMVVHWKKNFINSIQCKMFIHISIISLQSCKPMGVKSWLAVSDAKSKKTIEKLSVHFLGFGYSAHIHLLRYCTCPITSTVYLFWEHFNNWSTLQLCNSFPLGIWDPCPPIAMGGDVLQLLMSSRQMKKYHDNSNCCFQFL